MKRWVKMLVLFTVAVTPIVIGGFIHFGISEESFKVFVYAVFALVFGILWHIPKLKSGLLV